MNKAFVSWSGGKDSCLARYRALRNGMDVGFLLNMANEDGTRSRSHGLSPTVLNMQARSSGVPLIQRQASWSDYEAEFGKALLALKKEGVTEGIFGDIDGDANRQWVEQICQRCGITPHLPLWGENQENLISEFIRAGFKAIIVTTRADLLGKEWLGREINSTLIDDLARLKNITPCGESGEYHTLVTGGPLFNANLKIGEADKVLIDGYWFLDITKCDLSIK